jgi:fatty acid desaturase
LAPGTWRMSKPIGRIEWPTFSLIILCYALWFSIGLLLYPVQPILSTILFPIVIAFHSSLQHEVLHGHPTQNRVINELLVFVPIGLFIPYRRYRANHLRHHTDERLTDPYDDPESYYRALADWQRLPKIFKSLLNWNNTFLGRLTIGPALTIIGFPLSEIARVKSGPKIQKAWLLHGVGLAFCLAIVLFAFQIPLWRYFISAYVGLSILKVRSFCEHRWSERPEGRSIIVEKSVLSTLFLNNNLHLVHHELPSVAWYKLPAIYVNKRDEWHELNDHYVFKNYFDILMKYAFKAKEPVVHPALRRPEIFRAGPS